MPIYSGAQKLKTLQFGGQKIKEGWTLVGGTMRKVYSSWSPPLITDTVATPIATSTSIPVVSLSAADVGDTWVLIGSIISGSVPPSAPGWTHVGGVNTTGTTVANIAVLTRPKVAGDGTTVTVSTGISGISSWRCLTVKNAGGVSLSLGGVVRNGTAATPHVALGGSSLADGSILVRALGYNAIGSATYAWSAGVDTAYPVVSSVGIPNSTTLGVAASTVNIGTYGTVTAAPLASSTYSAITVSVGTASGLPLTAVSMVKSANQTIAFSAWEPVTPWTATGTATVDNMMRVIGSGNVTVEVGSRWQTSTNTKDWRVRHNGNIVWTKGAVVGDVFTNSFALTVKDGDVLAVEGWSSGSTVDRRNIIAGADTYLRVIPA